MSPRKRTQSESKRCNFCNKSQKEVGPLVASPNDSCFICGGCSAGSVSIIEDQFKQKNKKTAKPRIPSPREVIAYLDQYIVDQKESKEALSISVVNHYKRLVSLSEGDKDEVEIEKSNILLIGPTGSGKTLLAKTLAKFLQVPFAVGDATTLTEAGYVGEDVENLLLKLYRTANEDVEATEQGILYIDEVDKIARTTGNVSITRDVSGEGVQQALLKMLEGTEASVPPGGGRKHPEQTYIKIDTSNILFICAGTFVGLKDIVNQRIRKVKLGFGSTNIRRDSNDWMNFITTQDIVSFGLIPEFVGRLPIITHCNALNEDVLCDILTTPKNSLTKQFKKLFSMDGVNLVFEEEALRAIAREALKLDTGARALRGVLEAVIHPLMLELPDMQNGSTVNITGDMVADKFRQFEAA